jgi:hypothetical protein
MKRRTVKCELCGSDITSNNIDRHKNSKICLAIQNGKVFQRNWVVPEDLKCTFCGKEWKNKNSFIQHERLCKHNPNRQTIQLKPKTDAYYDAMRKLKESGRASNQYLKARELGLPDPEISEETRKKISENSKKQVWSKESKKKLSESMLKAVEKNPESYTKNNVCGRVKHGEYNGVKLKGSWELKTAQWLDSQGLKWIHEDGPFPYVWEGKNKNYFPDFFLEEHNLYLEVKGYKTERDKAKWNQFPHVLLIIDKDIIHHLDVLKLEDLRKTIP